MAEMEASIVIASPLREVYNQWTQFGDFPSFMEGVLEVQQLDDRRLQWRATVGGSEKEWDSEIVDQVPDQRIAWRSLRGALNAGAVLLEAAPEGMTKVSLKLVYEPQGASENIGDAGYSANAMRIAPEMGLEDSCFISRHARMTH